MKNFITTLLPLCYYFFVGVVATSCTVGQLDFTGLFNNQGVIGKGDNRDNTQSMEIEFKQMDNVGNRLLTPKEKEAASKAAREGIAFAREKLVSIEMPIKLHYVALGDMRDDDVFRIQEFITKHKKSKYAHPRLILLASYVYEIRPTFIVTEGKRTKERAEKLRKQGRSWTRNSRHTWSPAMALDIVSVRKGKVNFNDIQELGFLYGVKFVVFTELKAKFPCHTLEHTWDWKRVVDLYHWQLNKVKGCVEKLITYGRGGENQTPTTRIKALQTIVI